MGQVRGLNHRKTQEFSSDLKGEFFEVSTKSGRSYVGVKFDQKLPDGGVREFRSDLGRMEFIEEQARNYAESGTREQRIGRAGDTIFRFERVTDQDVTVQVLQKARDGSEEWQGLNTDARTLKAAVGEGKSLERDLGLDRKWHVLVAKDSLVKDEDGRIHAQTIRSFESDTEARMNLAKSGGNLALYSVPQKQEFSRGDTLELWPDATMQEKRLHGSRSVEHVLGQADWLRGRESEHYVLARWDDKYNLPRLDARTKVDGTGFDAANLQPEEFKAGYNPHRERGDLGEPTWVLIEKDPDKPGLGNIRGISRDREVLKDELRKSEAHKQEVHQAVTRDWENQRFGMDRDQHTRGHSM